MESSRGWCLEGAISKVCGRGEAKGTAAAPELEAELEAPACALCVCPRPAPPGSPQAARLPHTATSTQKVPESGA